MHLLQTPWLTNQLNFPKQQEEMHNHKIKKCHLSFATQQHRLDMLKKSLHSTPHICREEQLNQVSTKDSHLPSRYPQKPHIPPNQYPDCESTPVSAGCPPCPSTAWTPKPHHSSPSRKPPPPKKTNSPHASPPRLPQQISETRTVPYNHQTPGDPAVHRVRHIVPQTRRPRKPLNPASSVESWKR
ncbi:hypothetical protein QJS04_geneDACA012641 [Acorus gramineus]|uniref:Uncharacterized protein n=1 Tax=Acorus gramineus TaxID=55184 RepID=A0AAV9B4V3_ACOGR|nr:hypothetical protein QJS04_geneDACA012641 [Acorus gramineus]